MERYVRSSIENEPERLWNKQLMEWVPENIHYWNEIDDGILAYDEREAETRICRLKEILEKAREEYEYIPPNEYFKDGFNLYKRMYEDIESYVLFLRDPSVPPTNNLALCELFIMRTFSVLLLFESLKTRKVRIIV